MSWTMPGRLQDPSDAKLRACIIQLTLCPDKRDRARVSMCMAKRMLADCHLMSKQGDASRDGPEHSHSMSAWTQQHLCADRQRTLRELEVGRTLVKAGGVWSVRHGAADYKTGKLMIRSRRCAPS